MIDSCLGQVLQKIQDELFSSHKRAEFAKAFERISSRYRAEAGLFLQTQEERLAYLLTRLPGTFSSIQKVFCELQSRKPEFSPKSFLDVGAGPGTGMWAAFEQFSTLENYTLLEKDVQFMNLGKKLVLQSDFSLLRKADWKVCNLQSPIQVSAHDLVLLSYSIGEIEEKFWPFLFSSLWEATQKCLVVIEPGTPSGYQRLMKIRDMMINLGGNLWAPCPHSFRCPLLEGDWCHFSVRVPRSSLHRYLKSADLGYEDEKFCYLIFGKDSASSVFSSRVLRHPLKRSGHMELQLCTKNGLEKKVFSKKEGDLYKQAKKIEWGDCF